MPCYCCSALTLEGEKTLAFLPSQIPQEEGLLIPLLGFETFREENKVQQQKLSFIFSF